MNLIKEHFKFFKEKDLQLFRQFARVSQYEVGDILVHYNTYGPNFYYSFNGIIRGYLFTEEGNEHTLFFTDPEKYYITPETILHKNRVQSRHIYEAVTPCQVLEVNYKELLKASQKNEAIFQFYNGGIVDMLKCLKERVLLLSIENAEDRYKHLAKTRPFLVENAQKNHIAQFLGITPNSFSRILRKITEEN